ncbi:aspartic proteinase Asp1-like [Tripterygium wilfordii]|uniref:aspartic proteinase Asp1-like n=1 Tax=Tripterygium wilfordii TaxID=458696 RepID=UPI0018F85BA2|nr:aspartic proteinase Asp1-like [Tripterygium wilfordii]
MTKMVVVVVMLLYAMFQGYFSEASPSSIAFRLSENIDTRWCGYKQIGEFRGAGILGLSRGSLGFLSQMNSQGLVHNVIGHCLSSGEGGGFLFLGDDHVPPSGVSWTPITNNYYEDRDYLSGPADLLFEGNPTKVKGLTLDFDSGSALSFLNQPNYEHTLNMINKALEGQPMIPAHIQSKELSICWRQHNAIQSLHRVKKYFKNLTFRFTNLQDVDMDLPPQAYLILIEGKVCLGIANGDKVGLQNPNLIGAISMQDKLVIYDNVKHRIGWSSSDCEMDAMA